MTDLATPVQGHIDSLNPRISSCARCGLPKTAPSCALDEEQISGPVNDPRTDRNPEFERDFLKRAETAAGLDVGWARDVETRLIRMERAKGIDSFKQLGFQRLLSEIGEEGLDLGGWPVLACLMTFGMDDLTDEQAVELRMILQDIAACGVKVAGLIREARSVLDE